MRWFPDPWIVWNSYCPPKHDLYPSNTVLLIPIVAAIAGISLGICGHCLNFFVSQPRGACVLHCTAWSLTSFSPPMINMEYRERKRWAIRADHKLPVPRVYYFTKRGKYTADDFTIFGGFLGLLATSFGGRRLRVVGWQRHLGGFCIGSLGGLMAYISSRPKEDIRREYNKIINNHVNLDTLRKELPPDRAEYWATRYGKTDGLKAQPEGNESEREAES